MAQAKFVLAETELSGKRAAAVSGIIEQLVDAEGDVIPYADLVTSVGFEDQPAQMMPALQALELVGAIDRYTYVEAGGRKPKLAFALCDDVSVEVEEV